MCVLYLRGSRKIDRIVRLELRKTRNIKRERGTGCVLLQRKINRTFSLHLRE